MRIILLLFIMAISVFRVTVVHASENLLDNASFEKNDEGQPSGWSWHTGNAAEASCQLDSGTARSGKQSLLLKNSTPHKPHTYGMLVQNVKVRPNNRYTISCYVKSSGSGDAWIGGGRKWQHRFTFPAENDKWKRVEGSFNTDSGESQFTLRIVVENITGGLWIDDVKLESGGVATPFIYESPLSSGEMRLKLFPFDPGENLVSNSSMEKIHENCPEGWIWEKRNTDAILKIVDDEAHSGNKAVRISSTTPFGAHVYSSLRMDKSVKVKPDTSYTISAFIKTGKGASASWIGGGKDWKVRRSIPVTDGKWERVSHTFVTGEDETEFMLRIVTDRPTEELMIDDISLREGIRPVPGILEGNSLDNTIDLFPAERPEVIYQGRSINTRWAPQRWPEDFWVFYSDEFKAEGVATLTETGRISEIEVILRNEKGDAVNRRKRAVPADSKAVFIRVRVDLGEESPQSLTLESRLLRGENVLCSHQKNFHLVTPQRVLAEIKPLEEIQAGLTQSVAELESRGLGAYSRVFLTVLENFIPWIESDVRDGQIDRAWDTAVLLKEMAERECLHTEGIISGKQEDFSVPRYKGGGLTISHAQTVGSRRFPDGRTEKAPVFFTGYGHFNQIRRDVEKLPGYGCNFLQIEFGPRSVLPDETNYTDGVINDFLSVCDRAAASGVAVNLLLSPHYFPNWALDKWPYLKECQGGFFKYCVHDPHARAVIERSLRYVIPRIKDHSAIHSLCLSNEPISVDLTKCRVAAREWPAWLEKRHESIDILNKRWKTSYASFKDIPVPDPEFRQDPATLDFICFNQETFAEFHQWMADVIHSMAPDMPVHAKIMMGAHFHSSLHGIWCVSPELFAGLSQYNGNDAYNMYSQNDSLWSNGWRHNQAGYDFQRSMADLPVFNSENHIIVDRDFNVIPPAHIYSALWQNAVHGQSSTTFWVWERSNDPLSGLAGSILHRPDCVEAIGRCNLDLNRLAGEMAAVQNLPPTVCLLWSLSSQVLGAEHDHHVAVMYEAANFLGQPLGFVTERKLEQFVHTGIPPRPLDSAKVLILPEVTHLTDDARKGLTALQSRGMHIMVYGKKAGYNNYNESRMPGNYEELPECKDSEALFPLLVQRAAKWNLPEVTQLLDENGQPVFGVEIRSASYEGGHVASICNHLRKPEKVSLADVTEPVRDLISGRVLGSSFTVEPMKPMMIKKK